MAGDCCIQGHTGGTVHNPCSSYTCVCVFTCLFVVMCVNSINAQTERFNNVHYDSYKLSAKPCV